MRITTVLMGVLFLFSAAVQYNDPDPIRWLVVYLGAALVSFSAAWGRQPAWVGTGVGGVALAWAVSIALGVDPAVLGQMFSEFGMGSLQIEEGREAFGLLIVTAWMFVLEWKRASITARNSQPNRVYSSDQNDS